MCLCKAGDGFNILQGACLTAIHPIDGQRNSKRNDPVVLRFLMSVKFYQWRAIQANAHLDPRQYSALSVPREIGEHHERLPRLHSDQPTEKTCYRRSGFERQVNRRAEGKLQTPRMSCRWDVIDFFQVIRESRQKQTPTGFTKAVAP